MSTPTRILLVDDDSTLRSNLAGWLTEAGYQVLQASDALIALALLQEQAVDVVVTDLKMPHLSGLAFLQLLQSQAPEIPVIFLSGQGTMEDAIAALRNHQAFDFLQKPLQDLGLLSLAIEKALRHRSPSTTPTLPSAESLSVAATLSPREQMVLSLLVEGLENREIAERLHLSDKTIRNQLSVIYGKLGVTNRTQAALRYRQLRPQS